MSAKSVSLTAKPPQGYRMENAATSTLRKALGKHRRGRYEEASDLYGTVLRRDPNNVDAWHLWGVLALDQVDGKIARAIAESSISLDPKFAVAHLAGGMGKSAWFIVSHGHDWRWILCSSDSVRYPMMQLILKAVRNHR